ncbi:Carbepenem-hydrolyzing beta-lactamase KPC precursor [Amantichitinum ursilacus]|uniref:beta-lactamase n=1 Tax=Amantichitinum ursilacus TaxID=857265 RepID=A0A0N0GLR4_9NEIS|nr:Carbepenem-hydrolyzing beta-lactamase KPC precursor [Amantichitinum ursilacus]
MLLLSRRRLLFCAALYTPILRTWAAPNVPPTPPGLDAARQLAQIETTAGGRLGVTALDTGSGKWLTYRPDERFPLAGAFTPLLAAAVLARVEKDQEQLSRPILFTAADLQPWAPIARTRLKAGQMTVADLCAAAIQFDDHAAINLLLNSVGGPTQLTNWLRTQGDDISEIDRFEPELTSAIKGDVRDSSTPAMMLKMLNRFLLSDALAIESRAQLQAWLVGNGNATTRIRAGLPPEWRVGNATGNGENGTTNDLAIIWPPEPRAPILLTVWLTDSKATGAVRDAALKEVARVVFARVA